MASFWRPLQPNDLDDGHASATCVSPSKTHLRPRNQERAWGSPTIHECPANHAGNERDHGQSVWRRSSRYAYTDGKREKLQYDELLWSALQYVLIFQPKTMKGSMTSEGSQSRFKRLYVLETIKARLWKVPFPSLSRKKYFENSLTQPFQFYNRRESFKCTDCQNVKCYWSEIGGYSEHTSCCRR